MVAESGGEYLLPVLVKQATLTYERRFCIGLDQGYSIRFSCYRSSRTILSYPPRARPRSQSRRCGSSQASRRASQLMDSGSNEPGESESAVSDL